MRGPLEREATFYQYTLKRRITLRPEAKYSYITTATMGFLVIGLLYGVDGFLYTLGGLLLMLLAHAIVLRITLRRVAKHADKRWAFRYDLPWIGPLPIMDTTLSLFRRLHFHLLLVGCCVVALCYPWAPSPLLIALAYWHLWLLAPRYLLLLRTWTEKGEGIIRLESMEVSYYHQ